jgi:hypothetical protein
MRYLLPIILILTLCQPLSATTLKEMYDTAPAAMGYDRYIVLETGVTYTGGLLVGGVFNRVTAEFELDEEDVRIVGNGAILDLQGAEICLSYCNGRLDIDDCVVLNGNIRYRGYQDATVEYWPAGFVRNVTLYQPHDYGVRLLFCARNIELEYNLVVDPVDTGPDFLMLNGVSAELMPTGYAFSLSELPGWPTGPEINDNWTWFSDPVVNGEARRHFALFCDYG